MPEGQKLLIVTVNTQDGLITDKNVHKKVLKKIK